jgi:hypothetical protein
MEEIWKDIPNYEGMYQASNLGNIKSFKLGFAKILKPKVSKSGYLCVVLFNHKRNYYTIHILIAMTFFNHKPDKTHKLVVDHIDNNKSNNNILNLQLITQRQNMSKDRKGVSKYTGVYWDKESHKWRAAISCKYKKINLGRFHCEIEAAQAYQQKLKQLNNE